MYHSIRALYGISTTAEAHQSLGLRYRAQAPLFDLQKTQIAACAVTRQLHMAKVQ